MKTAITTALAATTACVTIYVELIDRLIDFVNQCSGEFFEVAQQAMQNIPR